MTSPADAPNIIPRNQYALFVRGQDGEPYYKIIQDLESQQDFLTAGLPALIAAAQATADAALALLTPFVAVNRGGTGLTGGTSGGVLAFTGPATIASSGALAAHRVMLGGGAGATPSTPVALGTAGWVLTSQGAGADPVFSAALAPAGAALSKSDDTNVTLALGGTPATALLQAVSITAGWTGTLAVARGGTALATLTAHAVYVGNGVAAPTALAVGATGTVLRGVTGADPAWGAVVLTTDVTGTLPVANGGTGLATLTAHALYVGNGTSAPTVLAVGATNTVLHGNTGADPSFSAVVEADITLANNTTNDVSITKHGFAPKAPNDATKYLDGTGAYTVPAGSAPVAATQADQETGTSTTTYVSPGRQQYHPSATKASAFITYAAGVPSAVQSYNVSSLTDTGVGIVTVNLTVAFSSANYPIATSCQNAAVNNSFGVAVVRNTASSFDMYHFEGGAVLVDPAGISFIATGDQ